MNLEYPYRFKTEQEFIEEYGEDWRLGNIRGLGAFYWNPSMNYLLGKDYPFVINLNVLDEDDIIPNCDEWCISPDMLTKKVIVPNYRPKVFIKEI